MYKPVIYYYNNRLTREKTAEIMCSACDFVRNNSDG